MISVNSSPSSALTVSATIPHVDSLDLTADGRGIAYRAANEPVNRVKQDSLDVKLAVVAAELCT